MDRKHFLKLLALGGLLPVVLPGCRRYGPVEEYGGKVIIIGAGAAGLYAASLLRSAGATVDVFEASDKVGGRIRELADFSDFPIELGAEEVHGQKSIWYDIVCDSGAKFVRGSEEDVFFVNGERLTEADMDDDADYQDLLRLIDELDGYSGAEQSIEAYLQQQGVPGRLLPLANALLGNEHGSSNSRVSVLGVAQEDALWTAGNKNFLLKDRSFLSILQEKFADVVADVHLNSLAIRVDYAGDTVSVLVVDSGGSAVYEADKVIVTCSVAALKAGLIQFVPGLPYTKEQAMAKIGMADGMKVILKFSSQFWPDDTGSIYGSGIVPEFWVTSGGGRSSDHVLTAFVNGENATTLAALGAGMVAEICGELDTIFGGTVATDALVDSHVENWKADPHTLGTYSYPMEGGGPTARRELAAPIGDKVYFAGEATHYEGHAGTVHGALESAYRAVEELVSF